MLHVVIEEARKREPIPQYQALKRAHQSRRLRAWGHIRVCVRISSVSSIGTSSGVTPVRGRVDVGHGLRLVFGMHEEKERGGRWVAVAHKSGSASSKST